MNAWASLSCLCITFWQVSIYSSAACMQKALFLYKEEALAWVNPLWRFFPMKFPFQVGSILPWMTADYTLLQWGRKGAGRDGTGGLCCTGRASSILHKSGSHLCSEWHRFCTCCLALEGHRETQLSPPQSPSPSLPLFLFFIFNYFLISKEKEICGRRQF